VAALTFAHIQQRDGRWCIVDLLGKHGRIRTTPVPNWVKVAIDAWTAQAGLVDGHVFRPAATVSSASASARKLSGRCSGTARPNLAFQGWHPMT
jgi:hypothetical protein